jgi:hypothetical protein
MHAGVDHQAHGAQHLVVQVAEIIFRLVEQAHLLAQRFGVQRPAFGEGVVAAELAEVRQAQLLHQRDVEVVARLAFVQEQRDHAGAAVLASGRSRPTRTRPDACRPPPAACSGRKRWRATVPVRGAGRAATSDAGEQRRQLGAQLGVELAVDVDDFLVGLERLELRLLRTQVGRPAAGPL